MSFCPILYFYFYYLSFIYFKRMLSREFALALKNQFIKLISFNIEPCNFCHAVNHNLNLVFIYLCITALRHSFYNNIFNDGFF